MSRDHFLDRSRHACCAGLICCLALLNPGCVSKGGTHSVKKRLARSLTFHASFDQGVDADIARGDRRLYHAPSFSRRSEALPGLPSGRQVVIASNLGRFGNALRFTKKNSPLLFFRAADNLAYNRTNWGGTVSFWLSLDPEIDLEPGYTDPIQITPKAWNDAAFFVEFSKDEKPREFRLGVYADFAVWNPTNRKWEEIPLPEKPLVRVAHPLFRRERWTHVVFTFVNFNNGQPTGFARLFLDGKLQGVLSPRQQIFSWKVEETLIMLGLSYIGLFDELSFFDRALTEEEIQTLYHLENGVRTLRD